MTTFRRRLSELIPLLAIVGIALVASAMYWVALLRDQDGQLQQARHRSELRAVQLNEAVSQQFDATLRGVDVALLHLRSVYLHNPREFERSVQDLLVSYPKGMLQFVTVFGADGRLQYLSDHKHTDAAGQYFGDREHFSVHANGAADQLFVSAPVVGRLTPGITLVQVTRGIWDGGRFVGVIGIPLRPDYLSGQLVSLHVDATDLLAVVRMDGSTIARSHNLEQALKARLPPERPFLHGRPGEHGLFRSTSTFDHIPLLFSWQRLADWPLVTVAAINETTELGPLVASLDRQRRNTLATITLITAFSLALGWLMVRIGRQKHELAQSEARHRALFERSKVPMFFVNPDQGEFVGANDAALSFYGYSRPQLLALKISDVNSLPLAEIKAEMELARSEKRNSFNSVHRLANGETRQVEVHSGPLEIDGQTLLHSIVHDVTDRKLAQQQLAQLMAEQRAILNSAIFGVVKLKERRFVWMNDAYPAMLGYQREELIGQSTRLVYASDTAHEQFAQTAYPLMRSGATHRSEMEYLRKDGSVGWYDISGEMLALDLDESIWSFVDITDRRADRLRLEQLVDEQRSILNNGIVGIVTVRDRTIVWANPAFERMLGCARGELQATATRNNYVSDEEYRSFGDAAYAQLAQGGTVHQQIRHLRRDGGEIWVDVSGAVLNASRGESLWCFIDITERKRLEDQVRQLAFHDVLTQLPNRRLLMDRLQQAMAASKRSARYAAIMFIDLDNFKPLNDAHGHDVGDLLLVEVAARLRRGVREIDTVARFGGDEFVLLLGDLEVERESSRAQAHGIAEKVRLALCEPYLLTVGHAGHGESTVTHRCSASIGVALFLDHQGSAEEVLKQADDAMYLAKEDGRNRVRFHAATGDVAQP